MHKTFGMRRGFGTALIIGSLSGSGVASAGEVSSDSHILGYQDTKTGTFHALASVVPDVVAPTTGTVQVTFNIKLVTPFAKGTVLNCNLSVSGTSLSTTAGTSTFYEEDAADSVAISGTSATCKVVIPYSWLVTPASATVIDSFSGSYSISAEATAAATGAAGTSLRSSSSSVFSTTKIPASGTTSSYTVNVTL
jgi:hypothetical protein